jgi:hypothetical protein
MTYIVRDMHDMPGMCCDRRKHALAESDLIGISQYTFEHWDAARADKYVELSWTMASNSSRTTPIRARNATTCARIWSSKHALAAGIIRAQ